MEQKELHICKQNTLSLLIAVLAIMANYMATVSLFLILCGSLGAVQVRKLPLCLFVAVPVVFYLLRCKCKKILPFLGMHLLMVAIWGLILYIGKNPVVEWFAYLLLLVVYIILSFVLKSRKRDVTEEPIHPAVFAGGLVVGFGILDYAECAGVKPTLLVLLVVFLGMYFAHYYLTNYISFVSVNKISDRNFQRRKLLRTGGMFVVGYLIFLVVMLLFVMNPALGKGVSALLKTVLLWILKLILLLFRGNTGEEPVTVDETVVNNQMPMEEFAAAEPGLLAQIVDAILEIFLYVLFVVTIIFVIRLIVRKLRTMFGITHPGVSLEGEAGDFDITERLEKEETVYKTSFLYGMTVNARIRKAYAKFMRTHQKRIEDAKKLPLACVTAKESGEVFENMEKPVALYEKARYSGEECQANELRALKKALSKVPD